MSKLLCAIHVLSLGMWFGTITFFSFFVALPLIRNMEEFAASRPAWLPGLQTRDEGTRLAGEALNALFARYFPVQAVCGVLALATALAMKSTGGLHRTRVGLIATALALALVNYLYLGPKVGDLRAGRYVEDPVQREANRREFGTVHTYSLGADMATLICVTLALAWAGWRTSDKAKN